MMDEHLLAGDIKTMIVSGRGTEGLPCPFCNRLSFIMSFTSGKLIKYWWTCNLGLGDTCGFAVEVNWWREGTHLRDEAEAVTEKLISKYKEEYAKRFTDTLKELR